MRASLAELEEILVCDDVSPFEIMHSGLVPQLLKFLTLPDTVSGSGETNNQEVAMPPRRWRLQAFLHLFFQCPAPNEALLMTDSTAEGSTSTFRLLDDESTNNNNTLTAPENGSGGATTTTGGGNSSLPVIADVPPVEPPAPRPTGATISLLLTKLIGCVNQIEQFQVKLHDVPGGLGRGGSNALKFFNTHQIKCNLQRHPDSRQLRQWHGGPVKIDPLALVQAIERYLVVRGYARPRTDPEHDNSEDENSGGCWILAVVVVECRE